MSTDITANAAGNSNAAQMGSIAVPTHHNDNGRTGANLNETTLTTTNVNTPKFGKLFERQVDGQIYAQILYVSNVSIPNQGTHNVVYVATMHNSVYAFDADDPKAVAPLWKREALHPAVTLPDGRIGAGDDYHDIAMEIGILGTPVISLDNNAIYCVTATRSGPPAPATDRGTPDTPDTSKNYAHFLHALDLTTGVDLFGGPAQIQAEYSGSGYHNDIIDNGRITFISNRQVQRPALLLANNTVYMAFAGYEDTDPYHGWIIGYDAQTLQQVAVYNTTPDNGEGGIWQAGQGPSADSDGNIYVMTGNGTVHTDGSALGSSVIKFDPNLNVLDWFIPYNYDFLNRSDCDVGSSGPLIIPNSNFLIGGGKEGKFFLLDRNNLGKFVSNTNNNAQIPQWFYAILPTDLTLPYTMDFQKTHHIHAGPIFWIGPMGAWIYIWTEDDVLKSFQFKNNRFPTTTVPPKAAGPVSRPNDDPGTGGHPVSFPGGFLGTTASVAANVQVGDWIAMPGGAISISANGGKGGTGIVWASHPHGLIPQSGVDANQHVVRGILRAYNAENLAKELWNSEMNPNDSIGNFAKFNPPTVANGKVYLASFGRGTIPSGKDIRNLKPQDIAAIKATYHFAVYGLH